MRQNPDTFSVYLDGKLQWTAETGNGSRWVLSPFGGDGHTLGVGGMIGYPNVGGTWSGSYKFDDIYVDYTWARVEMCDSPTWATCKHREVQPPVAWSNTNITIQMNRGTFQPGQQVFIYVLDHAGVPSEATPFVLPVGGATIAPKSPSGLSVRQ